MKKIIFIALFTFIFLATGCLDNYIPIEEYNNEIALYESQLEEANDKTEAKSIEIARLREEANTLENDLDLSNEEKEKYKYLLSNLNSLLSNIYMVRLGEGWYATGFSLKYNNKTYLITAGHCVENEYGYQPNLGFKANFSDVWIYPKLLAYENDFYGNRDYAIFYSDKVIDGLTYDLNNSYPSFILGNMGDNALKKSSISNLIEGESGSAVIDIDGEVARIATGGYVDIDLVIEAIDNLK